MECVLRKRETKELQGAEGWEARPMRATQDTRLLCVRSNAVSLKSFGCRFVCEVVVSHGFTGTLANLAQKD